MHFLRRQWKAKRRILATARTVRERTGKSVASQLWELSLLRSGAGRLTAENYFRNAVFDDRLHDRRSKRQFLSWDSSRLADALNDPAEALVCHDKLAFDRLMRGLGLPTPEIVAAYVGEMDAPGTVPVLRTASELKAFLRSDTHYPLFGKPNFGQYGRGVSWLTGYRPEDDRLTMASGEDLGVDDYAREYVLAQPRGYIFQAPIRQNPEIRHIVGERVASFRVAILVGDDGPRLFRVVWRLPLGASISDNFDGGSKGNLVAAVDAVTGTVQRVVQMSGGGGGTLSLPIEIGRHPETGMMLRGLTLPDWESHMAVCLRAAEKLPRVRYQSWDLVMAERGPLLLELNFRGGIDILQIASGRGLHDAQFREFWSRYAGRG